MIDIIIHRTILYRILDAIYSDPSLARVLGFKGGTACYFFHSLDRFSTDLDFDGLDRYSHEHHDVIANILATFGTIKDSASKHFTDFWLLSYGPGSVNIKIEINKRQFKHSQYEWASLYGRDVQLQKKSTIFAHKLCALTDRKKPVNRDLYDVNFFLRNAWELNQEIIQERMNVDSTTYLKALPDFIRYNFSPATILQGLGEVLSEKKKIWVKTRLIEETLGLLKMRAQ